MLNLQAAEKQVIVPPEDGALDVVGVWPTIQGEGPFAGCPAVFVRLAGCNLRCPGCDTNYTAGRYPATPAGLTRRIKEAGASFFHRSALVVVTGGEPFRQYTLPLVRELAKPELMAEKGLHVQFETNGSLPAIGFSQADWEDVEWNMTVVISPKTPIIHESWRTRCFDLKYIIGADSIDPTDGLPLTVLGAPYRPARPWQAWENSGGSIWVQPMDEGPGQEEKTKANTQACVDVAMKYGYRMSVQTHKILGVE